MDCSMSQIEAKTCWRGILYALFSVIMFFSGGLSFAATYYVSINGNDSNSGTAVEQPWRTIAKAVLVVSAGDTVNIIGNSEESPTVYDERLNLVGADSGLPGSWITFRAQPARSVVLLQVRTAACEYVRVEGFKITCDSTLSLEKSGIRLGSDNVEIIDNHIYDFRHYPAIHTVASSDNITIKDNLIERCNIGMWTGGNNWLVEDNEIRRLIRSEFGNDADYVRVFGSNHVYKGNYFYGTLRSEIGSSHTDGFQSFHLDGGSQSARDILIEDNLIMDCHQGIMIRDTEAEAAGAGTVSTFITNWIVRNNVFGSCWAFGIAMTHIGKGSSDNGVICVNNTLYDMQQYGIGIGYCEDVIVKNNIVAKTALGATRLFKSNYGVFKEDHNLFYNWNYRAETDSYLASGDVGVNTILGLDPKFIDPNNYDLDLKPDSPAMDSGTDVEIGGDFRQNGTPYRRGAFGKAVKKSKSARGGCLERPAMDFNKDCRVDFEDFVIFAQSWLD